MPDGPALECDLILKGGVTSGVVYPPAILKLSEKFRFRSIGGASAGAIAATLTAAAEYGRQARTELTNSGFEGLRVLSARLAAPGFVLSRFKPLPRLAPLFRAFLSFNRRSEKIRRARGLAVWLHRALLVPEALLRSVPLASALGAVAGFFIAGPLARELRAAVLAPAILAVLAFTFAGLVAGGAIALLVRAGALRDKTRAKFGICPGSAGKQADGGDDDSLALTDWLHRWINRLAGRFPFDPPLTIAELQGHGIALKLLSSNLSLAQAFVLPLQRGARSFFFKRDDIEGLFPPAVASHLIRWGQANRLERLRFRPGEEDEYLRFPMGEEMPLVVAARLSLSFPFLLSAVRLYSFTGQAYDRHKDNMVAVADLSSEVEEHWLSDGGITSNFPVHLFDSWLPERPTFGITLYDSPVASVLAQREPGKEVLLPKPVDFDLARPPRFRISSSLDFARAIFQAAQSHRDLAQSGMPGYRERIVQVFLRPEEGGLNLDMPSATVKRIQDKGDRSAQELFDRYLDESGLSQGYAEHVWVRALVLLGQLEKELAKVRMLRSSWPWKQELMRRYRGLLDAQVTSGTWYRARDRAWCDEAEKRLGSLLELIEAWERAPADCFSQKPPRPEGLLRVAPDT